LWLYINTESLFGFVG